MEAVESSSVKKICIFLSTLFVSLYIFFAHFNYPFSQSLLLDIGIAFALFLLGSGFTLTIYKGIKLYFVILLITGIGCFYTAYPTMAIRQFVFFTVYGILLWLAMKEERYAIVARRFMYVFALVGMISVYVQFFFTEQVNLFIQRWFRPIVYENVLWSNKIDGSFTGVTPSVSMASFSMAIVFFVSAEKVIGFFYQTEEEKAKSHLNLVALIFMMMSLFGIVLTNKRGIFLAVVLAFLLSGVLDRNISARRLTANKFLILCIFAAAVCLISMYFLSGNEQVAHFIERFQDNRKGLLSGRTDFYYRALAEYSSSGPFTLFFGKGTAAAYAINNTGIHNVYLQILFDHGIVGVVIYLTFFIYNLKVAVKKRYYYSMSLQIVFLAYCMTGNPLYDYFFFIPYLLNTQYKG